MKINPSQVLKRIRLRAQKKHRKELAYEESRPQLLRNAQSWGLDFQKWEEKGLKIICQYPESQGLEDHLLAIQREILEFAPQTISRGQHLRDGTGG